MHIKVLREFLLFDLFLVFQECAAITLPGKIFLQSFRQLASPPRSDHRSNVTSVEKASPGAPTKAVASSIPHNPVLFSLKFLSLSKMVAVPLPVSHSQLECKFHKSRDIV